ncbi:hypothetical protein J2809_004170 [Arthrobacter pascens]|nr:hypothetical protein [Arthrobacter pascens]
MTNSEDNLNPVEVLKRTPPPDDSGADTADRYEWQAMMATADVLAAYFEALDDAGAFGDVSFTIVCEHHEDWVVVEGNATEIVSGKHREASVGPFSTYRQVLAEGGLLHLFLRWEDLQQTPLCRLVTTGGLSDDGAKTSRVCDLLRSESDSQDEHVLQVIDGLQKGIRKLTATDVSQGKEVSATVLRAFLAATRIDAELPRRDQVPDLAGERFGRPVAERLGRPESGNAVWHATLALIRPRMRAAGPSRGGSLPVVLGIPHDEQLSSRELSLADVDTAVRFAIANAAGYAPLPRLIKANRMAVKMAEGGCSDNSIERADELRLQFGQYWRARRGTPSLSDQRRAMNNVLSRVIDQATEEVRVDGARWGAALWRELDARFVALEGHTDVQGLNADLLLGGASDLTNRCRSWYTDRFDAEGLLQLLISQRSGS